MTKFPFSKDVILRFGIVIVLLLATTSIVNAQIEKPKPNVKPSGGSVPSTSSKAQVELTWLGNSSVNIIIGGSKISLAPNETGTLSVKANENLIAQVEYPTYEVTGTEFIKFEKGKTYMDLWVSGQSLYWETETETARKQRLADEAAAAAQEEKDRIARAEQAQRDLIIRQREQAVADSIARDQQARREKEEQERIARQKAIDARNQFIRDSLIRDGKLVFAREIENQMVSVKGGSFSMGATKEQGQADPDAKSVHTVTVNDFKIGKFEVTQRQWKGIMGTNPSLHKQCDECPVDNVSYYETLEFIKTLNELTGKSYRLPTEAEWEFAARGGTSLPNQTRFAGASNYMEVSWTKENSKGTSHIVGQKKPNALGLYDMSGNVWEWCSDWYELTYYTNGVLTNPPGPSSGSYRVARGGSWFNPLAVSRVSVREGATPSTKSPDGGFRLAM